MSIFNFDATGTAWEIETPHADALWHSGAKAHDRGPPPTKVLEQP
jgi:hypothetical protein